jgi:hypothetical protein
LEYRGDETIGSGAPVRRGRPRLEDVDKTLRATEPWKHSNPPMSERTWFRRRAKPKA